MIKYTGPKKIKTAVFISGTGSNLKNLIKFSKQRNFPISIDLIISNNPKAKGLIYANNFKIKKKVFNFSNKIIAEKKILSCLNFDDIESFDDFCDSFGYSNDSIQAKKIYKKYEKEQYNLRMLFSDSELELLNNIC